MFKVNDKDIQNDAIDVVLVSFRLIWTCFTYCSGITVVDFNYLFVFWENRKNNFQISLKY